MTGQYSLLVIAFTLSITYLPPALLLTFISGGSHIVKSIVTVIGECKQRDRLPFRTNADADS
jgi:hypothetical protein